MEAAPLDSDSVCRKPPSASLKAQSLGVAEHEPAASPQRAIDHMRSGLNAGVADSDQQAQVP